MDRGKSNRADATTTLPRRALEHRLLVDVLVQMAKVLVESKRVREAKTGDPETTQSDSSGSRSVSGFGQDQQSDLGGRVGTQHAIRGNTTE